MKGRIVVGAVLLTLLGNLLCLSCWTKYDWKSLIDTYRNREARFDIIYAGKITGADPIQLSCNIKCPPPGMGWTEKTQCLFTTFPIRRKWRRVTFTITPIQDGKIDITLRGPLEYDKDGKAHPVLVDFNNLVVDGKVLFSDTRTLWYNTPFRTHLLKANKPVIVSFGVRSHHFNRNDFDIFGKIWFAITGNILSFLFFCKLLGWFSCQRDVRGGGIDGAFLVLFFVISFIPVSNISEASKHLRERRILAVKPKSFFEIFRKESDYGKRFESWFNDHFGGRDQLIKLRDDIHFHGNSVVRSEKGGVYSKKNGWLFNTPLILDYSPKIIYSVVHNIKKFNEFCREQNIRLYIVDVPAKEVVYQEYLCKFGFDKKYCNEAERIHWEVRDGVEKFGVQYMYPLRELRKTSVRDYTFFKWSQHWTDWGAYVGYQELMKKVKRDFPNIPVAKLQDYNKSTNVGIRDAFERSYRKSAILPLFFNQQADDKRAVNYIYYDHKRAELLNLKVGKITKDATYPAGRYKIMLMGTSQCDNFFPFLSYSGAQTKYIRLNMNQVKSADWFKVMKLYKKEILSFKPDILVFCIASQNLPSMQDLFKN